jgi:hypothetical protein
MSARNGTQTLHSIRVSDCRAVDLSFAGWIEEAVIPELKLQHEMFMWRSVGCRKIMAVFPNVNFLPSEGCPWSVTSIYVSHNL